MGYMRLGMQRWIYQQTSRKPFEKAIKKGCDTHSFNSPKELQLEGRFHQISDISAKRVKEGYKKLD